MYTVSFKIELENVHSMQIGMIYGGRLRFKRVTMFATFCVVVQLAKNMQGRVPETILL